MKRLHRLIVTSATYRQSSRVTPELLARDPQNRLLARGPRFRMEAELAPRYGSQAIGCSRRSSAVPASSRRSRPASPRKALRPARLEGQRGRGPLPPRPLHLHQAHAPLRHVHHLRRAQRRSLRGAADVSTRPLQALTLLNDPVFVEAARRWAGWPPPARTRRSARPISSAAASPARRRTASCSSRRVLRPRRRSGCEKELDAAAIAGGRGRRQRARRVDVARAVLNLDEAVVKLREPRLRMPAPSPVASQSWARGGREIRVP